MLFLIRKVGGLLLIASLIVKLDQMMGKSHEMDEDTLMDLFRLQLDLFV